MGLIGVVGRTLGLLLAGALVFTKVAYDYRQHGHLTHLSALLEVLIFTLHGFASSLFLDFHPRHYHVASPRFWVAIALIAGGLGVLLPAMFRLSWKKSVGRDFSGLRTSGLYGYTRNPQIVAYGLAIFGCALLWLKWSGVVWVAVYGAIGHMMVLTEEAHLRRVYGEAYEAYCRRVPRYMGWRKPG